MELSTAIALLAATAVLVAIPGPNVALIVASTIARGFRYGVAAVFGTTFGVGLQLALVVFGLSLLLEVAAAALVWLKWAGVAYLLYLGVAAWRRGVEEVETAAPDGRALARVFWQGVLVAAANPKTLLFNAAFLPQFIDAGAGPVGLILPAVLYLSVFVVGDIVWAAAAQAARPAILKFGRLRHRLTGGLFIGAGLGLALARADR